MVCWMLVCVSCCWGKHGGLSIEGNNINENVIFKYFYFRLIENHVRSLMVPVHNFFPKCWSVSCVLSVVDCFTYAKGKKDHPATVSKEPVSGEKSFDSNPHNSLKGGCLLCTILCAGHLWDGWGSSLRDYFNLRRWQIARVTRLTKQRKQVLD